MIGSFWNLCRACPSMPVDKQLHSEYRSTYRWHEFTGNSRPEVVRRAPAPNPSQFVGPTNEPPLPRRKKCPELAYKSHEFIIGSEYTDARRDIGAHRMARSEERGTPSRRSKSEGPPVVPNGRAYPIATEVDGTTGKQAGESNGLLKKTITKLSTEYRLQFVWPNVRRIKGSESNVAAHSTTTATTTAAMPVAAAGDYPRKSISMGAIRTNQSSAAQQTAKQKSQTHHTLMMSGVAAGLPTVHRKRTTNQKEATLHELEPLVSDANEDRVKSHEKQVTIVERKIAARPFSQTIDQERLNHFITKKENFGFADAKDVVDNKQQQQQQSGVGQEVVVMNGTAPTHSKPNLDLWFKEMVELRKKAGEYKCRGWGIEIDPDLYKKQKDLWDQVSKRSSLSALSLASTLHRPITKEEKEQENNKKSTPLQQKSHSATTKARVPGQAYLIDNKDEITALPARFSNIRHHLERTTGPDVEEGALLPSPTREKLMPAITKRESESQRGSPKKTAVSRHGSPQKGSPQKGSPKKVLKTRSQSVGPGVVENESPKRHLRSASQAPTARVAFAGKKTPTSGTTTGSATATERKARPSSLSTTFQHSRIKSSSQPPPSGRVAHVAASTAPTTTTITSSTAASTTTTTTTSTTANNQLHANPLQSSSSTTTTKSNRNLNLNLKNNNNQYNSNNNKSSSSQQQQQLQPQPQLRKKDKDRTNISYIGIGSASGSAYPVVNVRGRSASPSAKQHENKQKQQQIQQQRQQQQQQQQQQLQTTTAATTAATSLAVQSSKTTTHAVDAVKRLTVPGQDNKLAENEGEDGRETAISISSCSPQPVPEVPEEPLVKSPPEPTRVKSPEQIIMRSPDPVNWTVPLDTGKTFTVTQNVKEGENYSRPQSEIKASTPVEKPPPPPQSAPPQLTEQAKMDAWKKDTISGCSPTTSAAAAAATAAITTGNYGKVLTITAQPHATGGGVGGLMPGYAKPIPGSTLRCLEDPSTTSTLTASLHDGSGGGGSGGGGNSSSSTSTTTNTASTARSTAADVLEKARDRFDRFWGGSSAPKEENV